MRALAALKSRDTVVLMPLNTPFIWGPAAATYHSIANFFVEKKKLQISQTNYKLLWFNLALKVLVFVEYLGF